MSSSLSIVVPSYNQGNYLRQCLASIVLQLEPGDELIVMDGGSTDNSVQVIQQFAKYITKWVSARDRGQADAVNKAIACSTHETIVWINSDDAIVSGALKQARAISSPTFTWAVFGAVWINRDASRVSYSLPPKSLCLDDFKDGAMPINQPSCFFSRKLFLQLGGLDIQLHYALDYDLFVRMMRTASPVIVNEPFGINRVHGETKTSQRQKLTGELEATAQKYFGKAAQPYPQSLFRKYGLSLFWRFSGKYIIAGMLKQIFGRRDLPGISSGGLTKEIQHWFGDLDRMTPESP